jgi:hypothetical protein
MGISFGKAVGIANQRQFTRPIANPQCRNWAALYRCANRQIHNGWRVWWRLGQRTKRHAAEQQHEQG